jgi:lipoprotein-anchoring transpeptidase ErfK/SrfK
MRLVRISSLVLPLATLRRGSIHAIAMRRTRARTGALGLLVFAIAVPLSVPVAAAPLPSAGACVQIRMACLDAGFVQGAARDGIGLQIHCIMPIVQARPQPPTARRPLPTVSPQLVADCRADNATFGQARLLPPQAPAQPLPAPPTSPGAATPNGNPPPAYGGRGPAAPDAERDNALRPPMPVAAERRAAISALPPEVQPETGPAKLLPPQFRRAMVDYRSKEPTGTIVVDTAQTYLYLVLGNGKAMRYGIGVGREGFTWSGAEKVTRMAEWPDWNPPEEMIARQPYLPRFMAGGEGNPLGARALYLGQTLYRIHGTNQPSTIGTYVSSGCIRLTNDDVADLYGRVQVGTRVVVLSATPPDSVAATTTARSTDSPPPRARPKAVAERPVAAKPADKSADKPAATPAQAPNAIDEPASKKAASAIPAPAAPTAPPAEEMLE